MTDAPPPAETLPEAAAEVVRKIGPGWLMIAAISLVALIAVLLGGVRYGAITPQGRAFLEARTSGLKLGRIGRLNIEGLSGDIWRDFGVRRLTISDEKGVWLEAHDLRVDWRPTELFFRRFHADHISAREVAVLRRPTLRPKGKSSAAPLSIDIDSLALRLRTEPAFSRRAGDFDVTGAVEMSRLGGRRGNLAARSRLHRGDHLTAVFDFGRDKSLMVSAEAVEANGGALAGALGLTADRPFDLVAKASGTTSQGGFSLLARSGQATPLKAGGAWSPQGGAASGRLDLEASTLTRRLAGMFGPQAAFTISGRKAPTGLYDFTGTVTAQNLTLDAAGLADIGKRQTGPAGVAFGLVVGDLSRLTTFPSLGGGRARGVFRMTRGGFSLEGPAEVEDLSLAGYRLARVRGPAFVGWKAGELTLKAQAAGEGGGGTGLLAVLGATPKGSFEGVRLRDGRFLIRSAQVTAPNLVVDARGERGLLGGLTFKGEAKVASLTPVRAGAGGSATAQWTATQARDRPWLLSVDARAAQFSAGLGGELDRLLGPTPRLAAKAVWANEALSVSEARLDGKSGQARASGVLGQGLSLKFKLDWTAEGPFRVGPVEITGKAKGDGAITGVLSAPRADLAADFDSIDLPRLPLTAAHLVLTFARGPGGTDGTASLQATSASGPARGRTAFRFAPGGVELSELDVNAGGAQARGAVTLRSGRPSSADLTVAIGPGAFLTQGAVAGTARIVDAAGGATAVLDLTARDLRSGAWSLGEARVRADGPLARLPLTLTARGEAPTGRWTLNGAGALAVGDDYGLRLDAAGRLGRTEISTRESAQFRLGGGRSTARLRLAVGDGRADLDADLGGDLTSLRAELAEVSLTVLDPDLAGAVDGKASLQGRGDQLTGDFDARLTGARERGARADQSIDAEIRGGLSGDLLRIEATGSNRQGLKAEASLVLPTVTSAKPLRLAIDRRRAVQGRYLAQGEIKPLWDLLVGPERSLSGRIDAEGSLAGTLADPRLVGRAALENGRFEDGWTGLRLADLTVRTTLADNAIDVSQASATDGRGGSVSGGGRVSLSRDGASTLRLDFKGFQLIDNEMATAAASGQAVVNRAADGKVRLTGALTIDRADVSAETKAPAGVATMDVIERNRPADLDQGVRPRVARPGAGMALDVTLKAPRRVFVRGRGLDVELSLDAHVGGTTANPSLDGTARVVRGEYDFAGKRFEFDDNGVIHLATQPERIRLDLSATREDASLTAIVRIRGTAAKPEITLTSRPELPSDEVLSQVLFGASAAQLTPIEAAQLASALAALAGGGGFDVIGNLRSFAGLDRLAFAESAAGITVAGGKYVTDDVYLEIIGGGRDGPAAQVEWRIRRALSLVSRIGGQGDAKLSVRWRKDY